MELLSSTSPAAAFSLRRSSFYPVAVLTATSVRRMGTIGRLNFRNPKRRLRVLMLSSENDSAPLICEGVGELPNGDGFVEVIGIGSRKDAVIDFCLDSPFQLASSVRFWNVHMKDAQNMQLQEKCLTKDLSTRIVDAEQFLQLSSKAVILVASAGYGLDHVIATDILKTIGSRNGFAVAIFLKPFSFEGQRRQDEMKDLGQKVQEHTKFCIDIDTDKLLKKDTVTLDEALKTANSAVLLAINAISVLISGIHRKLFDVAHNHAKDLEVSEVMKILEQYKEAKIGFGAGGTIKSSILQALYDCPFIGSSLEQDFRGIVICIIASSGIVDRDANSFLHSFRQVAKFTGEIIMSTTYEPNLEPNAVVITVLVVGSTVEVSPQSCGLLSIFAQHFPFVFNLFGKQYQQSSENERKNLLKDAELSKVISSPQYGPTEDEIAMEGVAGTVHEHPEELTTASSGNYDDIYGSRNYVVGAEETEAGLLEDSSETADFYNQSSAGTPAFQRELLSSWNLGPGFQIAQEWAKERAGTTSVMDNFGIFCLPVGVKSPEELKDNHMSVSHTGKLPETKAKLNSSSWDTLTDAGLEAVKDLYTSASLLLKGKNLEVPKKQGVLSVRAASMLEAERDLPKKWSPVVEMQYRGGIYRGRCQGGLPEGKGRLVLRDGSIYDGMWRNGKRYGPGAFYFSNGDVFQGLWRDDMMHGKGWFYFHTGDRWFASFWKGKANGESRFYSKSGDVFFGHFQAGWRRGQFLCIGIDGARCMETWEEGILVCRKQLDSDTDAQNVSSTALT